MEPGSDSDVCRLSTTVTAISARYTGVPMRRFALPLVRKELQLSWAWLGCQLPHLRSSRSKITTISLFSSSQQLEFDEELRLWLSISSPWSKGSGAVISKLSSYFCRKFVVVTVHVHSAVVQYTAQLISRRWRHTFSRSLRITSVKSGDIVLSRLRNYSLREGKPSNC